MIMSEKWLPYRLSGVIRSFVIFVLFTTLLLCSGCAKSDSNVLYTVNLLKGWVVEKTDMDYLEYWTKDGDRAAQVDIFEDYEYSHETSSIVANVLGMHSEEVAEETLELRTDSGKLTKVMVEVELSAAESVAGMETPEPEIHYFYLSEDNLLLDIIVLDGELEEEIGEISTTIVHEK